jgi:uncharacterized membrane protein YphA (DoxX/SURF4 family)
MRLLTWAARVVLAAVFLWAASGKLADPQAFARSLWNYHLVPESLLPLVAVLLPVVEALAAVALFVPPLQRGSSLLLLSLLVLFTAALVSAMARGLDIDCGCFGEGSSTVGPWLLVRNAALALLALWSYLRA